MSEKVQIVVEAQDLASNVLQGIAQVLQGNLAMAALAVGAAFTAGIGAAVAVLKDLTNAAAEAELSQARFNALVDSSPLASYKEEMLGLADALSKVTRFEDENILEAEAMLATYQTIGEDVFPQALNSALDLAEFMKTDATSAAETLGRAFSDIAGGSLTMLYRQKLLTQEQKDLAEEMAKTGDAAGAQAFVMDILDGKIGNLAETMGSTFEGRLTIFKNSLANIKEELGAKLLPVLQPVIDKLADLALIYAPKLAEAFDEYVVPAVTNLVDAFSGFLDFISTGNPFDKIVDWFKNIDWAAASANLIAGIDSVDWAALGTTMGEGLKSAWETGSTEFMDFVNDTDWGGLYESGSAALLEFLAGLTGQGSWENVVNTWTENFNMLNNIIKTYGAIFRSTAFNAVLLMAAAIGGSGLILAQAILSWYTEIYNALKSYGILFYSRSAAWIQQAVNAVQSMAPVLIKAITDLMSTILGLVKPVSFTISLPNFEALAELAAAGYEMVQNAMTGGGVTGNKSTAPSGGSTGGGNSAPASQFASGTGGWLTVPSGFEDDTYPVLMSSGERFAVIPKGASAAESSGGGGNFILNLTYAPAFSTADRNELLTNLRPMLDEWYRRRLTA